MSKPAAGKTPLHPYEQFNVDMLKAVGAANGNTGMAFGQHVQVAAVDTVVTGLALCVAAQGAMNDDPDGVTIDAVSVSVGDQAGAPAAGSIYIKTWKVTSVTNPTLIAASGFTQKINWSAYGTPAAGRDDSNNASVKI